LEVIDLIAFPEILPAGDPMNKVYYGAYSLQSNTVIMDLIKIFSG
jgi:hypothetical protein